MTPCQSEGHGRQEGREPAGRTDVGNVTTLCEPQVFSPARLVMVSVLQAKERQDVSPDSTLS